jgi:hypothetical protein
MHMADVALTCVQIVKDVIRQLQADMHTVHLRVSKLEAASADFEEAEHLFPRCLANVLPPTSIITRIIVFSFMCLKEIGRDLTVAVCWHTPGLTGMRGSAWVCAGMTIASQVFFQLTHSASVAQI